jgi:hypothetical protein
MNFAFICDPHFRKKVSGALAAGEIPGHKIITLTANEFLETGKLPDGISAVIVEHGTWQKNFSPFRYYGLLPVLEKHILAFVASAPDVEIKGRLPMKSKDFIILNNVNVEEISVQLGRLLELPPAAYAHPKSRAIA